MSVSNTASSVEVANPDAGVSRVDLAEALSVTSRKASRDSLQADIDAFLAKGGVIQHVEVGVSAEPEIH